MKSSALINPRGSRARIGSVERWASERPSAIATIDGDMSSTWLDVNEAADRLAAELRSRGIGPGDIIITRMQVRSEWLIISAAAGKLSCNLLGLNWRLTPSEVGFVVADSRPHVLICDDDDPAKLLSGIGEHEFKAVISLRGRCEGALAFADLIDGPVAEPLFSTGNPPLILYTSGTTGRPKGVTLIGRGGEGKEGRRKIQEYQQSIAEASGPIPGDVVLLTLPLHHGAGPNSVWGAVAHGCPVVFQRRFDPEGTLRLIEQHRVSLWTGVPTMFKRLAALPPDVLAKYDVSSIRWLGVGAAPVPYSLKEWIFSHFGECLAESYGITETGMLTSLPPEMQKAKPGSSGRPYRHVELSIRDTEGKELPPREEGEIWVRTPRVIASYLNGPPLDRETLDANGFFRTGDVGHVDEENYLYITDRLKDMIVSGGVNIYPAEIEAAILLHPDVQDVAVIGVPDDEFGESVKAFCEVKPGATVTAIDILSYCAATLASYKRPRTLEIVQELPRNTMGKLLKRELRDPYWKGRERNV